MIPTFSEKQKTCKHSWDNYTGRCVHCLLSENDWWNPEYFKLLQSESSLLPKQKVTNGCVCGATAAGFDTHSQVMPCPLYKDPSK